MDVDTETKKIGKFQNLDVTLFKYSKVCHEKNLKILIASSPAQTTLGSTETLHCRIGRQGAHTVSWIRQVMLFHLSTIHIVLRLGNS